MSTEVELLAALTTEVNRIANALEILVSAQVPAPNYKRGLGEYRGFDWLGIGAHVLESDAHGPTRVEWNSRVYTRRNSDDKKKGQAIWFSAVVAGTVADGNLKWGRLITFKNQTSEPEPLDEHIAPAAGKGDTPENQPTPPPHPTPAPHQVTPPTAPMPAASPVAPVVHQGASSPAPIAAATIKPAVAPAKATADPGAARNTFYAIAGEGIRAGKLTAQEVNDLVRTANGDGFAAALELLRKRLA